MSFEDLPFTTSTTAKGSRSSSIFWSPTVLPWSAHWPRLNTPDEGSSDCRKTQTDAYIFQDGGVQPSRWCRPCCVRQDWWLHSPVHILTCNYWYSFRFPQLPFCPWLGYLLRCCLSLTWRWGNMRPGFASLSIVWLGTCRRKSLGNRGRGRLACAFRSIGIYSLRWRFAFRLKGSVKKIFILGFWRERWSHKRRLTIFLFIVRI